MSLWSGPAGPVLVGPVGPVPVRFRSGPACPVPVGGWVDHFSRTGKEIKKKQSLKHLEITRHVRQDSGKAYFIFFDCVSCLIFLEGVLFTTWC